MPTSRSYDVVEFTYELLQLIGKIAVSAAGLEHSIKRTSGALLFANTKSGLKAFSKLHFSNVYELLTRTSPYLIKEPQKLNEFIAKLDDARRLMGQRDEIMHSLWDYSEPKNILVRLKLKKRPTDEQLFDEFPVTSKSIAEWNKLVKNMGTLKLWFIHKAAHLVDEAQREKEKAK